MFTLLAFLLVMMLLFKCSKNKCTKDNIFGYILTLVKKIFMYVTEVIIFMIKKFTEYNWMSDE